MTPIATVVSRKGLRRKGRGFSEEEIKKAGLTIATARGLKVIVDRRRGSAYDSNVAELRKLKLPEKKPKAKKAAKAPAPVKAPKPEKKAVKKVEEKPKKPAKKPVAKKAAPKPKTKAVKPAKKPAKKAAPKSKAAEPKKK